MTNYIGRNFHKLTIINKISKKGAPARFLCRCSCGNLTEQYLSNISHSRRGHVEGCRNCAKLGRPTTHGKTLSREYRIWVNIKARCDNEKEFHYKDYGGRGITYDRKWSTFEGFWEDMKVGYSSELTIDRINNNGNYSRVNCHWATAQEQNTNQRTNIFIKYNNITDTISGWSKRLGIYRSKLDYRLKNGWPVEKAFSKQ